MDGLDRSENIFEILELRIVIKMVWQRLYFIDFCAMLLAGSRIMKGSALRFLRYPLTGLTGMMSEKYANKFLTQDIRIPELNLFPGRTYFPIPSTNSTPA